MYWSDVADLFACSDDDEEDMSGQGLVCQAITDILARGNVYDSSNFHVSFGDASIHEDAVVYVYIYN